MAPETFKLCSGVAKKSNDRESERVRIVLNPLRHVLCAWNVDELACMRLSPDARKAAINCVMATCGVVRS